MQDSQRKDLLLNELTALQAIDVSVIEIGALTTIADTMIVCSGRSAPHVKAIANSIIAIAKQLFSKVHVEQDANNEWILIDTNAIIIHIMLPDTRNYYRLEELWQAAPLIKN
jgi:ribosome-associated protein